VAGAQPPSAICCIPKINQAFLINSVNLSSCSDLFATREARQREWYTLRFYHAAVSDLDWVPPAANRRRSKPSADCRRVCRGPEPTRVVLICEILYYRTVIFVLGLTIDCGWLAAQQKSIRSLLTRATSPHHDRATTSNPSLLPGLLHSLHVNTNTIMMKAPTSVDTAP